jgi:hypothetical protein
LFSRLRTKLAALGLPGDNLNLYAVLDVFQDSETVEELKEQLIPEMLILII